MSREYETAFRITPPPWKLDFNILTDTNDLSGYCSAFPSSRIRPKFDGVGRKLPTLNKQWALHLCGAETHSAEHPKETALSKLSSKVKLKSIRRALKVDRERFKADVARNKKFSIGKPSK